MGDLKIYIAGTVWFGIAHNQPEYLKLTDPYLRKIADGVQHRLDSFHYVGKGRRLKEFKNSGVKVFLDSGAFSAYTLGATIDLDEYCNYIKENPDLVLVEDGILLAACLDGIGDPLLTYQNQKRMEAQGVTPLPVFHSGEDERYLEYYVAHYPYICLGGLVGGHTKQLEIWLDRVWGKYLLDGAGRPKCRVHGFGITSIPLMERYPWWSCDSTSWIQTASFGAITIPGYGNLEVSKESPSKHVKGHHINSLTATEREWIVSMLRSQGFDPDYIVDHYLGRATYNLWAYEQIQDAINAKSRDHIHIAQELF